MALTDVEICNRALVRLGSSVITSFSDDTDLARICSSTYDGILEKSLAETPWRFAMKKQQLARLTDTPPNEWKYAYQLPSDILGGIYALFNSSTSAAPSKHYEIFSDKVYTNENLIYVDYTFRPNETKFPSYFTEYMVLAIASQIAIAITDQANIADYYSRLAQQQLDVARYTDASQQPPQVLEDYTLIDVRN
jgi:hypothetical protein